MTARRFAGAAACLVALAAPPSYAQDPPAEKASAPPPAVARSAKAERRERPASSSAPAERAARGDYARPRGPVAIARGADAPAASASADDDQGGRRRPSGGGGSGGGGGRVSGGGSRGGRPDGGAVPRQGGVRNPDAGGGRGTYAQAIPRAQAPRSWGRGWSPGNARRFYGGGGFGYYLYDPWSWYGYGWGWPAYGAYGAWGPGWGGGVGGGWGNGWGGYYGGYGTYGGPYGYNIGSVRLRVAPRDAEVYVDGYYAGTVDDFDGAWQRLRLDDGGYRIEVKKAGFETLVFDVRVLPGRTITYRGTMVATP